jgi:CheY-like chemotaxis protein
MPSILTVDDNPDVRAAVSRLAAELGFEVAEARDGVEGLETLTECRFDLVILDVMMPNMDGPDMLARMRGGGDNTPVIMLTAESHRPTIARAMKGGIVDYVIKPFDPEELCRKITSVVHRSTCGDVVANSAPGGASAAGLWEKRAPSRPKRLLDLMVIDDMENANKRLRAMLPKQVSMNGFTSAQSALSRACEDGYRVILIDMDIPDIDSFVLAQQVRQLQPNAAIVALAMRTNAADQKENLKEQGFEAVLCKPFAQAEVDEFFARYFENQEFLTRDGNLLTLAPFVGKMERLEGHFDRLALLFPAVLKEIASASHGEVIVDLGSIPTKGDLIPRLLASVAAQATELEMSTLVVGPGEIRNKLASFEETKIIKCFGTVQEARAAGT